MIELFFFVEDSLLTEESTDTRVVLAGSYYFLLDDGDAMRVCTGTSSADCSELLSSLDYRTVESSLFMIDDR